jgi:hypothetical protein
MECPAMGAKTVDAPNKRLRFGVAVAVLLMVVMNFSRRIIYERDSVGPADVALVAIVAALFFTSQRWLLRVSAWGLVLLAIALPFGWFPVFGDDEGSWLARMSLLERILLLFPVEAIVLSVVGLLLWLARGVRPDVAPGS